MDALQHISCAMACSCLWDPAQFLKAHNLACLECVAVDAQSVAQAAPLLRCAFSAMAPQESPASIPPPPPVLRPRPAPVRWLLLAFAVLCLALGVLGIFVPGLPTTVFILMAAWAAARSSPRLHAWLWYHPLFGAMLRNWAHGGCVARRAKWSATLLMALCAAVLFVTSARWWVAALATGCMAAVLVWLWLRPEPQ